MVSRYWRHTQGPPILQSEATRGLSAADASCLESRLPIVRLRGVPFHAVTETECGRHVLDEMDAGRGGWIVTANLDFLRRLVKDASFSTLCAKASLIIADGMPIVWASRLQGTPLPERVAGSNLVSSLSASAAERGRSIFLLGGAPGTAAAAAAILQQRSPGLRVAGTACPELGSENDERAVAELADHVCRTKPDIIYVALGSPKQELVIEGMRHRLPATWWMGVGISLSYLCGHVRRAPGWMQRIGLEWLHRLTQEPRRLAKRYLLHDIPFACSLFVSAARAHPTLRACFRLGLARPGDAPGAPSMVRRTTGADQPPNPPPLSAGNNREGAS